VINTNLPPAPFASMADYWSNFTGDRGVLHSNALIWGDTLPMSP